MNATLKVWIGLLRPRSMKKYASGDRVDIPTLISRSVPLQIDSSRLRRYRAICGAHEGLDDHGEDELPAAYLQHLAGRLHLELLADRAFPLSAFGLIHVKNEIFQARPIGVREAELELKAALFCGGNHPKGQLIHIETIARPSGSSSETTPPWRSVITALLPKVRIDRAAKIPAALGQNSGQGAAPPATSEALGPFPVWELPANLGRRFSFLMGDYNPIHLWPWTAKLFGFSRPIIHGMWTLGRALQVLDKSLPSAPRKIEIEFKRPLQLPGQAILTVMRQRGGGALEFSVTAPGDSAPAVMGRVSSMQSAEQTGGSPLVADLDWRR